MTAEYTPRMMNFFIEANEYQPGDMDINLCALLSVSARFSNSSIIARYFQRHTISATCRFVERVVLRCFVSPLQFTPELRIGSRTGNNHRLDGANSLLRKLIWKTTYFTRSLKSFISYDFDDKTMKLLAKCINLEKVCLYGKESRLTDQVACIAALPESLQSFEYHQNLSVDGYKALAQYHGEWWKHLEFPAPFAKFKAHDLAQIFAKLPRLETFKFHHREVDETEEKELDLFGDGNLTKIKTFDDVLIHTVSKWTCLTVLDFHQSSISEHVRDAGVKTLTNFPRIRYLDLTSSRVSDDSLSILFSSETFGRGTLAEVRLSYSVSDESIVPLLENHTSTLEVLYLYRTSIGKGSMEVIDRKAAHFRKLRHLSLSSCESIPTNAQKCVAGLPALKRFYPASINDETLRAITSSPTLRKSLEELYMRDRGRLSDEAAETLLKMKALKEVNLAYAGVSTSVKDKLRKRHYRVIVDDYESAEENAMFFDERTGRYYHPNYSGKRRDRYW